eukprot:scaffold1580_cov495-Pavlova_lutheri.AAC.3
MALGPFQVNVRSFAGCEEFFQMFEMVFDCFGMNEDIVHIYLPVQQMSKHPIHHALKHRGCVCCPHGHYLPYLRAKGGHYSSFLDVVWMHSHLMKAVQRVQG